MLPLHAKAWCRGSSYLTSMAALGYNPLVATQIALDGKAADIINEHYGQSEPNKGLVDTKSDTLKGS